MEHKSSTRELALRAKAASARIGAATLEERNAALEAVAVAIERSMDFILTANHADVEAARDRGTDESLIDRLALTHDRLFDITSAVRELLASPDPLGQIVEGRTIIDGLEMKQVRVPLGVVGMIYEARPNVTADAAAIGIKTGNAMVLRGGSLAAHSNNAIAEVIRTALESVGLPADSVVSLDTSNRESAAELMKLHGVVDVLIPRGGAGLIAAVVQNSTVPTIETGSGNCHIYVEQTADLAMAHDIAVNAKCQRVSVCNSAETLLIDRPIAAEAVKAVVIPLIERGVEVVADADVRSLLAESGHHVDLATDDDFATEFLAMKISVGLVEGVAGAAAHINRFGTKHSEAVVTSDYAVADEFTKLVDAAVVYVNASTRFTDGGMFGLGAEIGISTQKLHARGPMGLAAMTSTKYILHGRGQVRG